MGNDHEWGSLIEQGIFEIYEERIEIKITGNADIKEKRINELKSFFS